MKLIVITAVITLALIMPAVFKATVGGMVAVGCKMPQNKEVCQNAR